MTLLEIQTKIAALLKQHENCIELHHNLCIVDGQLMILHADRTQNAPTIIYKLKPEQLKCGLTPSEWGIIAKRVEKALPKTTGLN